MTHRDGVYFINEAVSSCFVHAAVFQLTVGHEIGSEMKSNIFILKKQINPEKSEKAASETLG